MFSRLMRLAPVLTAAFFAMAASAAPVRTGHVEAELVPEKTALTPGGTLTVALRLVMDRGWHTYWRNPGESGLATTLKWILDDGLTAGPIQWPSPMALPAGPLVNYGYEGEVLLLTDIAAPSGLTTGRAINIAARADWLVCKEICIPEGADLSLSLPIAERADADPRWATSIARTRAELPRGIEGWNVAALGRGDKVELTLEPGAGAGDPGELRFFPYSEGKIEPSAPQSLSRDGAKLKLTLPVSSQPVGEFTRVAGVLTASRGFGAGDRNAVTIDVPLSGSVAAGSAPATAVAPPAFETGSDLSLWPALLFALIGGALLNLVPCVFPVLSLKVLGFAALGSDRAAQRAHGIAFGGGVIASFVLLAGLLVALRAGGVQLGWGFQLQSPVVIAGLAVLFFVLALNLSGVFEIGRILPSSVASWSARNAYVNDALSGVLAVAIASPCSAPFMGAAIGYGLAQSAATTLAVFAALGAGMALPYVLLAFFPGWRKRLPRPGPWMVRLRQVLAFPLYATVIWLAWVLGAQLDNDAVARLGAALLLVAIALWAWQVSRSGPSIGWRWTALGALLGAVVVGAPIAYQPVGGATIREAGGDHGPWQDYAPERVAQLTSGGRTVFVDFTAAWCVTCQVNKRLVLNADAVQQAFARHDVALLRADWTRRDATIGRTLAELGRSGVPVYVLYRPGREPLIFPEVLSRTMITDALASLQPPRLVTEAK